MSDFDDDEWHDRCRHDDDRPLPSGRTWACTMCGSTDWPNPDATCPLCREDDDEDESEDK
jgi:rubrerythrin